MKTQAQRALRIAVKAREDFQDMRKRMDNRLSRKADKKPTKGMVGGLYLMEEDYLNFDLLSKEAEKQEREIEKLLKKLLKRFPVYNQWLSNVKGVGTVGAAWILAEFDIEEAITVSKLWQYAGYNPGMVRGKKRISKAEYKPKMGKIVNEMKNIKSNGIDYIVETDTLIRGDRASEGFILPYNKNLKTRLYVLADGFIKSKSNYALEFYYPYKARLENEKSPIFNEGKARKDDGKPWCEVSKAHRDSAAKRYMMKNFLKDLYATWRSIVGLSVRVPYEEEYLGKKHSA